MTCQQLDARNLHLGLTAPPPLVPVALDTKSPAVHCKLEFLNPSGSTKDRIASFILTKAYRSGDIPPGGTVVEASSGSTSIAMAMVCAQLGLRFIAVMPEGVSNERSLIIRAYGGEVRFAPPEAGMSGCMEMVERLVKEAGAYWPRQFQNPDNAAAHRFGTAQEIVSQLGGQAVDAVISGVGTGGTLIGLHQGFTDHGCQPRPFVAKPVTRNHGARPLTGCFRELECCSFSSRIPGVVDDLSLLYREHKPAGTTELDVDDHDAIAATRRLIAAGFPVGPSSGLNYLAARSVATRLRDELGRDPVVVTVFPDRMERYFSTPLFTEQAETVAGSC